MTTFIFSRCYQAVLLLFCRYFPAFFAQKVCGRLVYVSRFPVLVLDYSEPAGWYFVDSFIFTHDGELEIGLEIQLGSVEYYAISDLGLTAIGINCSQVVSSLNAVSDFKTASSLPSLSVNA